MPHRSTLPAPRTPGSVVATAGGEIRGNKFWDVDGNGIRQTTEVGISGVTIFLDNNNNGVFEPALGEIGTTTITDDPATPAVNEAGNYSFIGLAFGTYIVREIVPAGFVPTTPTAVTVTITTANPIASNVNFGNRPANGGTGEIHGNKSPTPTAMENAERRARHPGGDLSRPRQQRTLTGDISTVTQNDNPNTPTIDETGNYDFFGLPPGTYIVREVVPAGYIQTLPAAPNNFYVVDIGQGTVAPGRNFGNRPQTGAIRGDKFRDLDGDGKHDPNEPGIGGVTIYIDLTAMARAIRRADDHGGMRQARGRLPTCRLARTRSPKWSRRVMRRPRRRAARLRLLSRARRRSSNSETAAARSTGPNLKTAMAMASGERMSRGWRG
jgi:hypothetical protein